MRLEWRQLGEKLLSTSARCRDETVLVAPFMKAPTLKMIVDRLSPSVPLVCLTRWRLEEIDVGVSDLECWDVLSERANSRLFLRSDLHAKYFRFDDIVYLGSANLTMTALGWSARPNAEALIEFRVADVESTVMFEQRLFDSAVTVTPDLVTEFRTMLESFSNARPGARLVPQQEAPDFSDANTSAPACWFPRSRSPEYMYSVYLGNDDDVSRGGLATTREDLLALDLPSGLPEPAFRSLVASRLATTPIVVKLEQFVAAPRRFGEIRQWLAAQLGVQDATEEWQRLMRWLLFFLPARYEAVTPNYSEVFGKRRVN